MFAIKLVAGCSAEKSGWSLCILVGWIPFLGGYPHNCGWNPNVCWLKYRNMHLSSTAKQGHDFSPLKLP
jgi:hypothetical protein